MSRLFVLYLYASGDSSINNYLTNTNSTSSSSYSCVMQMSTTKFPITLDIVFYEINSLLSIFYRLHSAFRIRLSRKYVYYFLFFLYFLLVPLIRRAFRKTFSTWKLRASGVNRQWKRDIFVAAGSPSNSPVASIINKNIYV